MDKKYSAKEAALAVLKKAEEMLKSSKLKGVHAPSYSNENDKGRSEAGDVTRMAGHNKNFSSSTKKGLMNAVKDEHKNKLKELKEMPKPNLAKQEDTMAMKEQDATPADGIQKDPAPSNTQPVARNGNPVWGTEPGSYKLAKFMGRKEEKAKNKAKAQQVAPAPITKGEK